MKLQPWAFRAALTCLLVHIQVVFAKIELSKLGKQLDVQTNLALLQKTGALVYGTIFEFTKQTEVSDGNIVHLAKQAYLAMENRHNYYETKDPKEDHWQRKKPNVITVLFIDHTAYIATSLRGRSLFYYDKTDPNGPWREPRDQPTPFRQFLMEELMKCSAATTSDIIGHRNGGSCGEFMAILAYEQMNGDGPLPQRARMVTVQKRHGEIIIDPPCNMYTGQGRGSMAIGCTQFWKAPIWNGAFTIIPENQGEEAFDVDDNDKAVTRIQFA